MGIIVTLFKPNTFYRAHIKLFFIYITDNALNLRTLKKIFRPIEFFIARILCHSCKKATEKVRMKASSYTFSYLCAVQW